MLIDTCGGAMLGYCMTGSRNTDSAPASIKTIASTHANTGRSMKNCEITSALQRWATPAGAAAADCDRSAAISTGSTCAPDRIF